MLDKFKNKWRFAIGTTSRVPDSGGYIKEALHYLIADFDSHNVHLNLHSGILSNVNNMILQKTPHGYHLYTDYQLVFSNLVDVLRIMGADPAWIRIGEERGYYFLADKHKLIFPWPVEHMVLSYDEKKT